ncbi:uncharacterized protein LOC143020566 [Oratosquilla oratoria]|uniref:uncharacterized protein LOC143020566 n=1 Tax=Oratosquilla oratoria TaxID=337810 RepID=UPI003F7576D9
MAASPSSRGYPATRPLLVVLLLDLLRASIGQQIDQGALAGSNETSANVTEGPAMYNNPTKFLDKRAVVGSSFPLPHNDLRFRDSQSSVGSGYSDEYFDEKGYAGVDNILHLPPNNDQEFAGSINGPLKDPTATIPFPNMNEPHTASISGPHTGSRDGPHGVGTLTNPLTGNMGNLPTESMDFPHPRSMYFPNTGGLGFSHSGSMSDPHTGGLGIPHSDPHTGGMGSPQTGSMSYPYTGGMGDPRTGNLNNPYTGGLGVPHSGSMSDPYTGGMGFPQTGSMSDLYTGSMSDPHTGGLGVPHTGSMGAPQTGNLNNLYTGDMSDPHTGGLGVPHTGSMNDPYTGGMGPPYIGSMDDPYTGGMGSPYTGHIVSPSIESVAQPSSGNKSDLSPQTTGNYPLGSELSSPPIESINKPSVGDRNQLTVEITGDPTLGSVGNLVPLIDTGNPLTKSPGSSSSGAQPIPPPSQDEGTQPMDSIGSGIPQENPGQFAGDPMTNFPAGSFSSSFVSTSPRNCLGSQYVFAGPQPVFRYKYPSYGSYFTRPYFVTNARSIPREHMMLTPPMLRCPWQIMNSILGGYMPMPFHMNNPSPHAKLSTGSIQNHPGEIIFFGPPHNQTIDNKPSFSRFQNNPKSSHFEYFDPFGVLDSIGPFRHQRHVLRESLEENQGESKIQYTVDPQNQETMDDSLTWRGNNLNNLAQQNNNQELFDYTAQPSTNTNSETTNSLSVGQGDATLNNPAGHKLTRKPRSANINIQHVQNGNQFEATLKFNESCSVKASCTIPSTWASLSTSFLQHLSRKAVSENLDLESFFCSCSIKEISATCPTETRELINVFSSWCTRGDSPRGMRNI